MATHGIEIRDAAGNIVLDNTFITNRLWYSGIHSASSSVYFPQDINHEPAIAYYGINGIGGVATPIMENGQCIGVSVTASTATLVLVFAKR